MVQKFHEVRWQRTDDIIWHTQIIDVDHQQNSIV